MLWKFPGGCQACRAQACVRSDGAAGALLCCCWSVYAGTAPHQLVPRCHRVTNTMFSTHNASVLCCHGAGVLGQAQRVGTRALRALRCCKRCAQWLFGRRKRKKKFGYEYMAGARILLPQKPEVLRMFKQPAVSSSRASSHTRQNPRQQRSHQSEAVRQDTQTHAPHTAAAARHAKHALPLMPPSTMPTLKTPPYAENTVSVRQIWLDRCSACAPETSCRTGTDVR